MLAMRQLALQMIGRNLRLQLLTPFSLSTRLLADTAAATSTATISQHRHRRNFSSQQLPSTIEEEPLPESLIANMTDEELLDTSTIPGWELIHSPPRKFPRGALVGTVVSDKMQKTVNVAVDRYRLVPKIRKRVKYTRKFMAHDEHEVANSKFNVVEMIGANG
jgi:ribosomal protein S17